MLPVRQLTYKVNNVEAAIKAHHRRFGSGPFFVARHIALESYKPTPQLTKFYAVVKQAAQGWNSTNLILELG